MSREVAEVREGDAALVALEGLLAGVRAPGEEGGGRVGLPWERRLRGDPGTPITHICRVRELPVAKATPHSSHLKGFSPVCVRLARRGEGESGCRGDRRRRGGSADHSHVILEAAGARGVDVRLLIALQVLQVPPEHREKGGGRGHREE